MITVLCVIPTRNELNFFVQELGRLYGERMRGVAFRRVWCLEGVRGFRGLWTTVRGVSLPTPARAAVQYLRMMCPEGEARTHEELMEKIQDVKLRRFAASTGHAMYLGQWATLDEFPVLEPGREQYGAQVWKDVCEALGRLGQALDFVRHQRWLELD